MTRSNRSRFFTGITAVVPGLTLPIAILLAIPNFFSIDLAQKKEPDPVRIEMITLQQKPNNSKPETPKPNPQKKDEHKTKPQPATKKIEPKKADLSEINLPPQEQPKIAEAEPIPTPTPTPTPTHTEIPGEKLEPAKPSLPDPVPLFKLTELPQFLHREELTYPDIMRIDGQTGIVELSVLIDKEGKVHKVTVLKSAGEDFDFAARKALLASTFVPAKIGNKAVAVELRLPVKFKLL